MELEPVVVKTYKEVQGIEYDIREAYSESLMAGLANKLNKDNFLTEGLNFDMFNGVVLTQMNLSIKPLVAMNGTAAPTLPPRATVVRWGITSLRTLTTKNSPSSTKRT